MWKQWDALLRLASDDCQAGRAMEGMWRQAGWKQEGRRRCPEAGGCSQGTAQAPRGEHVEHGSREAHVGQHPAAAEPGTQAQGGTAPRSSG